MMLNRLFWKFMHRFHPKYQYHKINIISLSPGYYDPDVRMLHACFDLFAEWFHYNVFEEEMMDKETIDSQIPGLFDEMMTLYKWWTVVKPEFDAEVGNSYEQLMNYEAVEDQMLARLIAIRRSIWYL